MTEELTPFQRVVQVFNLPTDPRTGEPMVPYPLQLDAINALAPCPRSGWWAEVGCGKTLMSTVVALFKKITGSNRTFVLVPPILILMWAKWLRKIPGINVAVYRGTPKERKAIQLDKADFIIMSMGVFKNDFDYLVKLFEHLPRTVLVDEATAVKNVETDNYKRTRDFAEGYDLLLLTGTPLSTPGDAYAYVKLISPMVYRNQRHFEALHVEERDFFDNVKKWCNLEFLSENMKLNAIRILTKEMLPGLADPIFVPIPYDLEPEHLALYRKLADEQILLTEDGGKIDATVAQRLYNMLQQIILNPAHFTGDPSKRPAAYDVLDLVMRESGLGYMQGGKRKDYVRGSKLIVVANYIMSNNALVRYLEPFGAVAIYGEVSAAQKDRNFERFMEDPDCGVMIVNPISGGKGLDGMQHICSDMLLLEMPIVPWHFTQVVGRIARDGQVKPACVRIACAQNTIQVHLQNNMLNKDELVNRVVPSYKDLREAIFGDA